MKRKTRLKNRLASARRRRQLRQKHIAALLGHKSTNYVSKYELGTTVPGLKCMIKLSLIYRTPIRALLNGLLEVCRREISERKTAARAANLDETLLEISGEYCTVEERLVADSANELDCRNAHSHAAKLVQLYGEKMGHYTPRTDPPNH